MIYRNKKTGAEIETKCIVTGGDWELVESKPAKTEKAKA